MRLSFALVTLVLLTSLAAVCAYEEGGVGALALAGRASLNGSTTVQVTAYYTGSDSSFTTTTNLFTKRVDFFVRDSYLNNASFDCVSATLNAASGLSTTSPPGRAVLFSFTDCFHGTAVNLAQNMSDQFTAGENLSPNSQLIITSMTVPQQFDNQGTTTAGSESSFPTAAVIGGTLGGLFVFFLILLGAILVFFIILVVIIIIVVIAVAAVALLVGGAAIGIGSVLKFFVYTNMVPPEAGDEDQDLWSEDDEAY